MTSYVGIDLSLNHFGLACRKVDKDITTQFRLGYSTIKKKFLKRIPDVYSFLMPAKKKEETTNLFQSRRREWITNCVRQTFESFSLVSSETYVAMEDYAYTTRTNSSHQLAEVVGIVRHYLWEVGYPLLLIDPSSLKLWATGKGNAYKRDIVHTAKCLTSSIRPETTVWDDQSLSEPRVVSRSYKEPFNDLDGPVTDMADATTLSYLVEQKVKLTNGSLYLSVLPEHQKKVFTRTTKSHTVRLLDEPFIVQG